uniref:Cathepsin 12 n=1 Tax=Cyclopterus lumpus TaxID=8103 RepID=A0A8C2XGY1_CYCLU
SFIRRAGFLLLSALLIGPRLAASESDEVAPTEWEVWKSSHSVAYEDTDDMQRRNIWETNKQMIEDNNQGFFMGRRPFTMFSPGPLYDLSSVLVLYRPPSVNRPSERRWSGSREGYFFFNILKRLQKSTRLFKYTSQGFCGSCWAFSTTGAIEGQIYKKTGQLVSLSEQNLVDCSRSYGTYGCNGAWMANAYDYVVNNGLQATDAYPYSSVDTQPCYYDSRLAVAHIKDYRFLPKGDEQALADAVATVGPITVAIDADHSSFLFYSSGIYDEPTCNPNNLSHAVLLVGYGSDGGQDYWIIKNSWGSSWGEGGYMRMVRDGRNTCGIASYALYPVL